MLHCNKKYGAVLPPSPKSAEQDMPLKKTGGSPDSSHVESQREMVQKAQDLITGHSV
jgi:hypothetical protein